MAKLPTLRNPFSDAILGLFCADLDLIEAVRGATWNESDSCLVLNLHSSGIPMDEFRGLVAERLRLMSAEAYLPEEDRTIVGPEEPVPFTCKGMVLEVNGQDHLILKIWPKEKESEAEPREHSGWE